LNWDSFRKKGEIKATTNEGLKEKVEGGPKKKKTQRSNLNIKSGNPEDSTGGKRLKRAQKHKLWGGKKGGGRRVKGAYRLRNQHHHSLSLRRMRKKKRERGGARLQEKGAGKQGQFSKKKRPTMDGSKARCPTWAGQGGEEQWRATMVTHMGEGTVS